MIKEISTLLAKAKMLAVRKAPNYHLPTDEEIELALGWLQQEVTLRQVQKVLKKSSRGSSEYYWLLRRIRAAYRQKRLVIKR